MGVTSKQKIKTFAEKPELNTDSTYKCTWRIVDQTVNSNVTDNCLNCVFKVQVVIFHSFCYLCFILTL